jgi:hypothetical protein
MIKIIHFKSFFYDKYTRVNTLHCAKIPVAFLNNFLSITIENSDKVSLLYIRINIVDIFPDIVFINITDILSNDFITIINK